MADNQNNQKYFLDLAGLTILWNKIKSKFADKEQTQTDINDINISINDLNSRITLIDNDVTEVENTLLYIAPRDVNFYFDAIEASASLAPGTMINVKSSATSAEDDTPSGYAPGIYVVTAPGEIQYLNTSEGDINEENLAILGERIKELEETSIKSVEVVDEDGNQLDLSFSINDNVLLIAHDNTFDINSNSVKALTHKAIAAKFRDIESTLTQIPKFKISVVNELPTNDISLSTIYLVRNTSDDDKNLFVEYIYVEHVVEGKMEYYWEKLGEQTLIVDDIITTDHLNTILTETLADYAKNTDIQDLLTQASEDIKISVLQDVELTYAKKTDLEGISTDIENLSNELNNYLTLDEASTNYLKSTDAENTYLSKSEADNKGWVTGDDVLTSIQFGEIGNALCITENQLDELIKNN